MERTIAVLNGMVQDGIIQKYAIGGAMAAVFYTEPIATCDLDVFVRTKGFKEAQEHLVIEGVPVKFIPAYNALVEEAVERAKAKLYGK